MRSKATVDVGDITVDPAGALRVTPERPVSDDLSIAETVRPPAVALSVVTTIGASASVEVREKSPSLSV